MDVKQVKRKIIPRRGLSQLEMMSQLVMRAAKHAKNKRKYKNGKTPFNERFNICHMLIYIHNI